MMNITTRWILGLVIIGLIGMTVWVGSAALSSIPDDETQELPTYTTPKTYVPTVTAPAFYRPAEGAIPSMVNPGQRDGNLALV